MIDIDVFSEEKAWSKKLKKEKFFFDKICNAFPKKYKFVNKKISLSLLLSNNKNIKKYPKRMFNRLTVQINQSIWYGNKKHVSYKNIN